MEPHSVEDLAVSRRGLVLFVAMCVIWGIPYLLIKVSLEGLGPVDLVFFRFALGALLMAWDFIVKLRPLYPQAIDRLIFRRPLPLQPQPEPAE